MVLQLCKEILGGRRTQKLGGGVGGVTPLIPPNWQLLEVGDVNVS